MIRKKIINPFFGHREEAVQGTNLTNKLLKYRTVHSPPGLCPSDTHSQTWRRRGGGGGCGIVHQLRGRAGQGHGGGAARQGRGAGTPSTHRTILFSSFQWRRCPIVDPHAASGHGYAPSLTLLHRASATLLTRRDFLAS